MTTRTQISVSLLLPEVPDVRDACLRRLTDLLESHEGIDAAHAFDHDEDDHAANRAADADAPNASNQLCIHFSPEVISLGEVRELAERAGAELHERYGHLLLKTEAMHASRADLLAARIEGVDGVIEAAVSPDGVVRVEFDRRETDDPTLRGKLDALGVHPRHVHGAGGCSHHHHHHGPAILGEHSELAFSMLCGVALATGWILSGLEVGPFWLPTAVYVAAYFFGGFFTLLEVVQSLKSRRFEIDFLMLFAAIGAAALGHWAEGSLLLFLFSLGHALEHYAMGRARRAIEALSELAPKTASVRDGQQTRDVPIEQVRVGDIVVVKPDTRIPTDGFLVAGDTTVNQAPLTGESMPVDKRAVDDPLAAARQPTRVAAEHQVFAGTINGSGGIEVQVTRGADDSSLARMLQLVAEAETHKSPTQRFTDRFARYFVPTVLVLVVTLMFAWVVVDEPFSSSFYRAMAVLVAASPCALAISTPSAVLSGVARAAQRGVLVKGGGPLENLGKLTALAFDKTGTLTAGRPSLTDVVPAAGSHEHELLRVAVALERGSDHPLALAVASQGLERLGDEALPDVQGLKSVTGRGVIGQIADVPAAAGNLVLLDQRDACQSTRETIAQATQLQSQGRTTVMVQWGDRVLGVLGLMDAPREDARATLQELRKLGVQRMVMLSGDHRQVVEAVAEQVGIDEAWGDLMPNDKVEAVKKLRSEGEVAMIGDGVNDAPAMANATVGIAMGAAGSDVALETADVALMSNDLRQLPFALGLSRMTYRVIRQNLWFSLGMVAFLIPATILGARMGIAVALHEGSTLLVVVNALRLLAFGSLAGRRHDDSADTVSTPARTT